MEENYVPIVLSITVEVSEAYRKDGVKNVLLEEFSDLILKDGRKGFFHPENFRRGRSMYLSEIYLQARKISGVISVQVTEFKRLDNLDNQAQDKGIIEFWPFEKFTVELSITMK